MKKTMPKHGVTFLWSTRQISLYFSWAVIGYVTYFCTDYIGLNPAVIGTLFLVSKIADAVSNFVIAYIVDNSHHKLGKGRPWDINIIPYWITIILIFAIPASWGTMAKYILVFLYYTLNQAVFGTFLSCIDTIYFKHTFKDEKQRTKVQAFTGGISMVAMTVGGIVMPILIAYFQTIPNGWTIMALVLGVPMAIFGSLRYWLIPETDLDDTKKDVHVSAKDTIGAFVGNKYVIIITLMYFAINLNNAFGSAPGTYYFKWIVGDVALQSVLNLVSIAAMLSLFVVVPLSNKIGRLPILRFCFLLTAVSCAVRFFAGDNVAMLSVCQLLSAIVTYPFNVFSGLMLIDAMDYGEWKNGKAVEGAIFAASSLGSTIGNGVGAALGGIVIEWFGYDGSAQVQTATALFGIKFSYAIVPAILMLLIVLVLGFYDLDKKMPQIKADLEMRRSA